MSLCAEVMWGDGRHVQKHRFVSNMMVIILYTMLLITITILKTGRKDLICYVIHGF